MPRGTLDFLEEPIRDESPEAYEALRRAVDVPFAVNGPVACGGVLVMPGDIVVADDDGAVAVPVALATRVIESASQHHEWENFSRERLAAGGDLRRYYPLSDAARPEYEAWKARRQSHTPNR